MPVFCHHPDLSPFVDTPEASTWKQALESLRSWGTMELRAGPHGLFPAVPGGGRNEQSGYQSVWLRDNVHVAHALWRTGDRSSACRTLDALLEFQLRHRQQLDELLAGRADPDDPMQRPHVRFRADTLTEIDQRWAHAQNDALGYVLWLAAILWGNGDWKPSGAVLDHFARLTTWLGQLPYFRDRDSGHWEEGRAQRSSSIGVVVAALEALVRAMEGEGLWEIGHEDHRMKRDTLEELARGGRAVLDVALPAEVPDERQADAALLFLLLPLDVVDDDQHDAILDAVHRDLVGRFGIRRYVGDSYWCGDYRRLVAAEARSSDYSDDTTERDRLLQEGEEAQWCLFDPLLAVHHARRFHRHDDPRERDRALWHLRRALGQVTGPGEWCAPGLCPEAYFLESRREGRYRPNDHCPLAWTQAHLRWAVTEVPSVLF